jgi:protein-L-isoaspartate(D-aspartate) O-methyltransferase
MDPTQFDRQREAMLETQIAARGVRDARVLEVMRRVPRHAFVPDDCPAQSYEDHPVNIGCGQTISQPYMVAAMTELLDLRPTDRVLEIGTGSGYQTAILAELAEEIVSLERHPPLADTARALLKTLGYANVTVLCGDGTLGDPGRAPFDAILVTAGAPEAPKALQQQLAEGGRLVCPAGGRDYQSLLLITRTGNTFDTHSGMTCVFVPLIGAEGWPEHA